MRLRHRPTSHRCAGCGRGPDGQRGAAIVELAMVAMLLLAMLAAAFDLGMGWRNGLAVNEGARAGVRVGSGMGTDVNADRTLLTSAKAALESSGLINNVTRVVVFRATNVNGSVPSTCKTATAATTNCNIFTAAQFKAVTSTTAINATTGCLTGTWSAWCPNARINVQLNADYVGVWIQAEVNRTFGLIGKTQRIERTAVMRIEPQ